ncbi:uncharacterized protein LOC132696164 [Cylas formicarius]|uniref:uncharacterized protein LOC132696164 n=1 Tax=Cylas formicarius TaxID=197179 RepID=UPI0029585473|nr:uncharacterized protein LOC132696164 [Cylas formicarius]
MSGDIHSGVEEVFVNPEKRETHEFVDKINDVEKSASTNVTSLCCEVCDIKVTSAKILQKHLEGRRHRSRVERVGKTFYCDICEIRANSDVQLKIHLTSSKHRSRVARKENKEFTDLSSSPVGIYVMLFCAFCFFINFVILVKINY